MTKRLSEFLLAVKVPVLVPQNSIQQNESAAIEWAGRIWLEET